jgi:hypothetical protein
LFFEVVYGGLLGSWYGEGAMRHEISETEKTGVETITVVWIIS